MMKKSTTRVKAKEKGEEQRYAAPALEKGLDLIETLAESPDGIAQKALAQRVGRTVAEIFRMLSVLERRGYVLRDSLTGQYGLTLKLFELAHRHPPTRRLLQVALPVMQDLAERIGQSCHLVIAYHERIVVIAEERSSLPMGFGVRPGASFPMASRYVSARVLTACQPEARRAELARRMLAKDPPPRDGAALAERLRRIAEAGYDAAPSEVHHGITDISFPVCDALGATVAALTVPLLPQRGAAADQTAVISELRTAVRQISRAMGAPA